MSKPVMTFGKESGHCIISNVQHYHLRHTTKPFMRFLIYHLRYTIPCQFILNINYLLLIAILQFLHLGYN